LKIISVLSVVALISGCAANSGVIPMGQEMYTVSRQAASGWTGSGTLKAEALTEAGAFCAGQKRGLQVVSMNEAQPPFVLGNFPKAEVQFRCI
jgi:hypothetical protein